MTIRIGSLFSGAGGLDLAVEAVFGGRTVWHCEQDAGASAVLAARWPGVPNLGDITAADWGAVEPIDVLCGGFPCQDVSSAGRRAGIREGTRSGLWSRFADAIDALRPRAVVIENVRGLLSAKAIRTGDVEPGNADVGDGATGPVLRAAGAVLGDLADLGYDAQWATVAAADIGAPHKRERVFVVAHPRHGGVSERARAQGRQIGQRPSVGERSGGESVNLLPTPTTRDHKGANQRGDDSCPHGALLPTPATADADRGPDFARAGREGSGGDDLVTICARATRGRGSSWGKYEPAIRRWEELTRPAPSPTEPNSKGNPRLASPFSEWMMGWPGGWVTAPELGLKREDQLRIIGNGVVPQQAYAAINYLIPFTEETAA